MASEATRVSGHVSSTVRENDFNTPANRFSPLVGNGELKDDTLSSIDLGGRKIKRNRRDLARDLLDKQNKVLGQRGLVREHRTAFSNARNSNADLEALVEQKMRNHIARPAQGESASLSRDIEILVEKRERLRLSEEDYNQLEDNLNTAEWEMIQLERKVFGLLDDPDTGPLRGLDDESDDDFVHVSSAMSDDSVSVTRPFVRKRLLSRIGDRDMLLANLDELQGERDYWEAQQDRRAMANLGEDLEGREFLKHFSSRNSTYEDDLRKAELEIDRLRKSASEQASVFYMDQFDATEKSVNFRDHLRSLADKDTLEDVPREPLLWPVKENPLVFPEKSLDPSTRGSFTAKYINAWLWHFLRCSHLEIIRFKTNTSLVWKLASSEDLVDLIKSWWFAYDASLRLNWTTTRGTKDRKSSTILRPINPVVSSLDGAFNRMHLGSNGHTKLDHGSRVRQRASST